MSFKDLPPSLIEAAKKVIKQKIINKVDTQPKSGEGQSDPSVNEMKDDPCWKGYKMVGMKKKGGKPVPNCVPVKEEEQLDEITRREMESWPAEGKPGQKSSLTFDKNKIKDASVDALKFAKGLHKTDPKTAALANKELERRKNVKEETIEEADTPFKSDPEIYKTVKARRKTLRQTTRVVREPNLAQTIKSVVKRKIKESVEQLNEFLPALAVAGEVAAGGAELLGGFLARRAAASAVTAGAEKLATSAIPAAAVAGAEALMTGKLPTTAPGLKPGIKLPGKAPTAAPKLKTAPVKPKPKVTTSVGTEAGPEAAPSSKALEKMASKEQSTSTTDTETDTETNTKTKRQPFQFKTNQFKSDALAQLDVATKSPETAPFAKMD